MILLSFLFTFAKSWYETFMASCHLTDDKQRFMSKYNAKFNPQDRPEFAKVLNSRVNSYFKDNNISRFGNLEMQLKTVFIVALYFIPLGLLLTSTVTNIYAVFVCWIAMGFGMSFIGLSIMHDANHGSYSNNKTVNVF